MDYLLRQQYYEYIKENSAPGSGTAHSYVAALDMLGAILQNRTFEFSQYSNLWNIKKPQVITKLYEFVKVEQRKKHLGAFGGHEPSSYWEGGYYSAALGRYSKFLKLYKYVEQHEEQLWKIYKEAKKPTAKLSRQLENLDFKDIEKIVQEKDIDFRSKVGKDILIQTKTRVNQDFFRKMILAEYNTQCCITGLNIPEVLRASHIVGWAEDKNNRMNPANGLCLSATYDAAFDRHLISFDDDYRLILSSSLKEHYTNKAFKEYFLAFEGQELILPGRFYPDCGLLERHRGKMLCKFALDKYSKMEYKEGV